MIQNLATTVCTEPMSTGTAWAIAFMVVGIAASVAAIAIAFVKWSLS